MAQPWSRHEDGQPAASMFTRRDLSHLVVQRLAVQTERAGGVSRLMGVLVCTAHRDGALTLKLEGVSDALD